MKAHYTEISLGDKRTAYRFSVSAAGVESDAFITEDGRRIDYSWDGVWFSGVASSDTGFNVEIKIPFKSIQYRNSLEEWGINFKRFIPPKDEVIYWAPMKRNEGLRVSKFGILKGIKPRVKGRNLEVFPVSLLRHDRSYGEKETRPDFGLDINWGLSSSTCTRYWEILLWGFYMLENLRLEVNTIEPFPLM